MGSLIHLGPQCTVVARIRAFRRGDCGDRRAVRGTRLDGQLTSTTPRLATAQPDGAVTERCTGAVLGRSP
jgi:hypothetical protein